MVTLEVYQNHLNITAEKPDAIEESGCGPREGFKCYQLERLCGAVHRQIKLPLTADASHITARMENGILIVNINKRMMTAPVVPPVRVAIV